MRIGIVALLHESNTFLAERTTLEHFRQDVLLEGPAIADRFRGTHHELGGFFAELEEAGADAVPIFAARALPFGTIEAATFDTLVGQMLRSVAEAGGLDGLLVAPHGATVAENHADADGHWLTELRNLAGLELPIISTLDPHANLSRKMLAATDAIVAYRTNPHVDQRACGQQAARVMLRTLAGELRPVMAAVMPPMAINIERQLTSASPCRELYALADDILHEPRVVSDSILLGFPYADVAEMGCAALVITDNDPQTAKRMAERLGGSLWEQRELYRGELTSVEEAVQLVRDRAPPVCLLDMGDNVGGGSPADGTVLLHALAGSGVADSFVCLWDPQAVTRAEAAGVGARIQLSIGGRSGPLHGPPFESEFVVVSLHGGKFQDAQPRHGGFVTFDQGRTALVRTDNDITLMLTSRRMAPFSLEQLTSCGLEPSKFRCIVAKGVHAPLAAYAEVCKTFVRVNTPGVTTADMAALDYQHRRRPMFPFEPDTAWQPQAEIFSR